MSRVYGLGLWGLDSGGPTGLQACLLMERYHKLSMDVLRHRLTPGSFKVRLRDSG